MSFDKLLCINKDSFHSFYQIDGETKVTFPLSKVKSIASYLDRHRLVVSANVTEDLTNNVMSGNGTVTMYYDGVKLEFPKSNPKTFKLGLEYTALVSEKHHSCMLQSESINARQVLAKQSVKR